MKKGVDISRYNGACDFSKYELDFMILKAGSVVSGKDARFEEYYKNAKKYNIPVGAYWYCYAKNVPQAIEEADKFLNIIKGKQFEYPLYLDLEDPSQKNIDNEKLTDIAIAFMARVQRSGYYVGIYSMGSWFTDKLNMNRLSKYDLWVARWRDEKYGHGHTGKGTVGMWQYTNKGRWKGIRSTGEGGADTNIAYKDYPSLIKEKGLNGYSKGGNAMNEVDKVVNKMVRWIGKNERDGSHMDIINIYNADKPLPRGYTVKRNDEWCATTISACFINCGLKHLTGKECSVQRFIGIFKGKGIWIENGKIRPQRGDIICYNWDDKTQPNDGWADHIGLVEKVEGNTITVIEGNLNERIARRTINVGNGYIRGYARPKYQSHSKLTKKDIVIYKNKGDLPVATALGYYFRCDVIPDNGTVNKPPYLGSKAYNIKYVGAGKDRWESARIALDRYIK